MMHRFIPHRKETQPWLPSVPAPSGLARFGLGSVQPHLGLMRPGLLGILVEPVLELAVKDPAIEVNLRQFCLVLSMSLGMATLSRAFSVLRIPYTLLLLVVLGLAVLDVRLINLSPELILFITLPPLLFEAA